MADNGQKVENAIIRQISRSDLAGDKAKRAIFDIFSELDLRSFLADPDSEFERLAELLEDDTINRFPEFTKLGQKFSKELMRAQNAN